MSKDNLVPMVINGEIVTSGLADKKLKTSREKFGKLQTAGENMLESLTIEEAPPLVLEPIKEEEMVKPVEEETEVVEKVNVTPEVSLFDTKNYGILPTEQENKNPGYSFESKVDSFTYAEQPKSMVSNGLLNIKSTKDLRRDSEGAEGPIERQTIAEIIKESEAKDMEKKQKEDELQEILRQEEEIKRAKDQKQKEVRECVENRKKSSQEWTQTIAGAKKVDLYDRTLKAEEEKGLAELEAKKAQLKEKQERLMAEREKVVSDYKLDLTPEEEQMPVLIEKNENKDLDLSPFYATLSGVEKDINHIGDAFSFEDEELPKIR